ncbi:hypothetical protein [Yimella sp. cx-51]|uniref:hypothetical protein n=1 Tax=Yimella sp. cx-51 TaxID=2770551 RepID=UPI00165EBCE2|nr:hypothetical protein [Yimella sp. cx-51]MBC9957907.1 hypothetical protein [Yimella sp. cx-51]QTH38042.1 hypothetical protein J5M86_14625 [Yimella sp. cx-51]
MRLIDRAKHILRPDNRRKFKAPWILANVGYDVIYTLVMIKIFGQYGINGWVYVAYIAVFSLLYAWGSFELVGALVDGNSKRAHRFGALTVAAFLAPDIYLVVATHNVPWHVWAIFGTYVCVTATAAVIGLRKKVMAKRAEQAAAEGSAHDTDAAVGTPSGGSDSH